LRSNVFAPFAFQRRTTRSASMISMVSSPFGDETLSV